MPRTKLKRNKCHEACDMPIIQRTRGNKRENKTEIKGVEGYYKNVFYHKKKENKYQMLTSEYSSSKYILRVYTIISDDFSKFVFMTNRVFLDLSVKQNTCEASHRHGGYWIIQIQQRSKRSRPTNWSSSAARA